MNITRWDSFDDRESVGSREPNGSIKGNAFFCLNRVGAKSLPFQDTVSSHISHNTSFQFGHIPSTLKRMCAKRIPHFFLLSRKFRDMLLN